MTSKLAITYTVKDEELLLPRSIRYHSSIGFSQFFVYLDGSTDCTGDLVRSMPGVTVLPSVPPAELGAAPPWVQALMPRWAHSMDVRKRINTWHASRVAGAKGCEWLACIDPDELLLFDKRDRPSAQGTRAALDSVEPRCDQVLLPVMEVLPSKRETGEPFLDNDLFLRRRPIGQLMQRAATAVCRRAGVSGRWVAWLEHLACLAMTRGALPRLYSHPGTGQRIPAGLFLGYTNFKSMIRPQRTDGLLFNIHRWQAAGRRPHSMRMGNTLHYDLCSAGYFVQKFRMRDDATIPKVFWTRHMLARIARDLPAVDARRFFHEHLALDTDGLRPELIRRGIATAFPGLRQQLESLAATTDAAAATGVHSVP